MRLRHVARIGLLLFAYPAAGADEPTPVRLVAGEVVNVCKAGLARCPLTTSICDDPKVALVENGPDGAVLKGISPGTTLCSLAGDAGAFRRLVRVKVEEKR